MEGKLRNLLQWLHTTPGSCAGEAVLTGKASWSGQGSTCITGGKSQGGARKRMRNSEKGMNDQLTNLTILAKHLYYPDHFLGS